MKLGFCLKFQDSKSLQFKDMTCGCEERKKNPMIISFIFVIKVSYVIKSIIISFSLFILCEDLVFMKCEDLFVLRDFNLMRDMLNKEKKHLVISFHCVSKKKVYETNNHKALISYGM